MTPRPHATFWAPSIICQHSKMWTLTVVSKHKKKKGPNKMQNQKHTDKQQQQCVKNFVRYKKRKTGHVVGWPFSILQGQKIERGDGKRYVKIDTGEICEVPSGYKRDPVESEWICQSFCKMPIDRAALEAKGFLNGHILSQNVPVFSEYDVWMTHSRAKWMTIADVLSLPPGVSVRVVVFHRNTGDDTIVPNVNPRGCGIKPVRFFRKLIANYRPSKTKNRMACDLWFGRDEASGRGLELDVEYKPGRWYPLKNGILPAYDEQHGTMLLGLKMDWNDLPRSTRVNRGTIGVIPYISPSVVCVVP